MKVKTLLIASSLVLLGACDESKYDLEELVPEQYHKILYVNNSGKQEVTLYDTDEDNLYSFSVFKSGSDPNQTAVADISVLTQAELDKAYSEVEGTNYKRITDGCYSLGETHLDFSVTDRYKLVNISLKPQNVKEIMETDPDAVWVLPLQVTSETDSVNANKNELFLQIAAVIKPALGFTGSEVEVKGYDYGSVSTITEKIEIGLDTSNKWDLSWELAADGDYVNTYNAANGTLFKLLEPGTYSFPETMELANGTNTTQLTVTINGGELQPGDYMLPIRIKNLSLFEISSAKAVYPLAIRILGPQLARTGWTADANTRENSGEGSGNGVPNCAIDGNTSTYWHSRWQSGSDPMPYELIIDTQEEHTFTQFGLQQRQAEAYTDTRSGKFYVSSDKETWTEVGSFLMQKVLDLQVFAITPAKGRYFKIKITESYRDTNCSLSEVYAYGLK